jgi:hypothetical protein
LLHSIFSTNVKVSLLGNKFQDNKFNKTVKMCEVQIADAQQCVLYKCGGRKHNEQRFAIGLWLGQKFFNVAFCSYLHPQYFNVPACRQAHWAAVPGERISNFTTTQSPIVI